MQRRPSVHSSATKTPQDNKRAILLSVLCSLGLILTLALLASLWLPHGERLGGGNGSGGGSGAGTGTSDTDGSGGTGVAGDGGAGGAGTGSGTGGDAQGDSKTSGTETAASTGNGSSTGGTEVTAAAGAAGKPDDQPAAAGNAPAADARPAPPSSARAPATPPPEPLQPPGNQPQVMALGNLKFTDKSASVGTGVSAGGPGAPAFFGSRGKGTRFVYIVDRSGSMTGDRFEAAREELKKSIRTLRAGMFFHVIFYDSVHEEMPGSPLFAATADNIAKAINWIDQQSARGGTDPEDAMLKALELKPHTIWLLTDGQFGEHVCERITAANPKQQVSVNTIAFHDRSGEPLMQRIAKENRGDYRFVPAPNSGPSQPTKTDREAEWEKAFGKKPKP